MYPPLVGRETILAVLLVSFRPLLVYIQIVYSVSHWRLDKVVLVAVVLFTVYIIRGPLSGW